MRRGAAPPPTVPGRPLRAGAEPRTQGKRVYNERQRKEKCSKAFLESGCLPVSFQFIPSTDLRQMPVKVSLGPRRPCGSGNCDFSPLIPCPQATSLPGCSSALPATHMPRGICTGGSHSWTALPPDVPLAHSFVSKDLSFLRGTFFDYHV